MFYLFFLTKQKTTLETKKQINGRDLFACDEICMLRLKTVLLYVGNFVF